MLYMGDIPYSLDFVQLPEGVTIRALLTEVSIQNLRLDLDMGLVLSLLRDDEEADKVNPYMGRPIKSAQQNDSCFYSAR